jgi:glycosyltransferase involved in cell wall biosynthesis
VALRGAIEELLGDPGERTRLGAAALETAADRFSHEACARALVEVYAAALRAT